MLKANNRTCRVRWIDRFGYPVARWVEDIKTVQHRVDSAMPRILKQAGYTCERCREARQAAGEDGPWRANFELRFLAEGGWNRTWLVEPCTDHPAEPSWPLIMRVALPAITRFSKVRAEVATMDYVRNHTKIPVPDVLAHSSTAPRPDVKLEAGYEWILMTKMPGVPYADVEDTLPLAQKRKLAETLADWVHSLSLLRFDKIGTLFSTLADGLPYVLGPPVMRELFAGDWRNDYDLATDPFPDAASLAHALVRCRSLEAQDPRQYLRAMCCHEARLARLPRADFRKPGSRSVADTLRMALRPKRETYIAQATAAEEEDLANGRLVPKVSHDRTRLTLPQLKRQAEEACPLMESLVDAVLGDCPGGGGSAVLGTITLQHWDIHRSNLLVDPETGELVALLDWEYLYTAPIATGDRYPWVMTGRADEKEVTVPVEEAIGCNIPYSGDDIQSFDPTTTPTTVRTTDRAVMRSAFDARLARLDSPWLASYVPLCVRDEVTRRETRRGGPAPVWPSPAQEIARQVLKYARMESYRLEKVRSLVEEAERAGFVVMKEKEPGKGEETGSGEVEGANGGKEEDEDGDFMGISAS